MGCLQYLESYQEPGGHGEPEKHGHCIDETSSLITKMIHSDLWMKDSNYIMYTQSLNGLVLDI